SFRSLGETEHIARVSEQNTSAGLWPMAGIVAYVDLQLGAPLVNQLLALHRDAARGRLRGIRNLSATATNGRLDIPSPEPSLLASAAFRAGFSLLQPSDLIFEAWMFHTQLGD